MPIVRSGYAVRKNRDNWTRARNRRTLMAFADRCEICHEPPTPGDPLEADHIIPVADGGNDTSANLRAVHRSYNRTRGRGGAGVCRRS